MFSRKRYRTKVRITGIVLLCSCILTLGYASLSQDISIVGEVEGVTAFKLNKIVDTALASGELVLETGTVNDFQSNYYYKGENPSNYLIFANKCFRIVNIAANGSVKIVYDGNVSSNGTCDTVTKSSGLIENAYKYNYREDNIDLSTNNWFDTYEGSVSLRKNFESLLTSGNIGGILLSNSNLNNMADANWYVGAVNSSSTQTITEDMNNEKYNQGNTGLHQLSEVGMSSYSYTGKVGLLNVSDYVKASSNSNCTSVYSGTNENNYCGANNYLAKNYKMIFINPVSDTTDKIWATNESGMLINSLVYENVYVRPVFYLVSGLNYAGDGTVSNPYIIV